jgi:hypothetical protein
MVLRSAATTEAGEATTSRPDRRSGGLAAAVALRCGSAPAATPVALDLSSGPQALAAQTLGRVQRPPYPAPLAHGFPRGVHRRGAGRRHLAHGGRGRRHPLAPGASRRLKQRRWERLPRAGVGTALPGRLPFLLGRHRRRRGELAEQPVETALNLRSRRGGLRPAGAALGKQEHAGRRGSQQRLLAPQPLLNCDSAGSGATGAHVGSMSVHRSDGALPKPPGLLDTVGIATLPPVPRRPGRTGQAPCQSRGRVLNRGRRKVISRPLQLNW